MNALMRFVVSLFPFLRVIGPRDCVCFAPRLTCKQFPNATTPNSNTTNPAQLNNATSPPFYPSPWMDGSGGWAEAYAKAQAFVKQLTLLEKVNLTTGVG